MFCITKRQPHKHNVDAKWAAACADPGEAPPDAPRLTWHTAEVVHDHTAHEPSASLGADGSLLAQLPAGRAEHAPLVFVATLATAVYASFSLLRQISAVGLSPHGLETYRSRDLP